MTELQELLIENGISVRAQNVCAAAGWITTQDLLDYWAERGSFLLLLNSGRKTNLELCSLVETLRRTPAYLQTRPPDPDGLFLNLNTVQKRLTLRFVEGVIKTLPHRASRHLLKALSAEEPLEAVYAAIAGKPHSLQGIETRNPNANDLPWTATRSSDFSIETKSGTSAEWESFLREMIRRHGAKVKPLFEHCKTPDGQLQAMKFAFLLFRNVILRRSNLQKVFFRLLTGSGNQPETLQQMGNSLQLTRERIRQLRLKVNEKAGIYFSFFRNMPAEVISQYPVNPDADFIVVDRSLADKLNQNEMVDFNERFYAEAFAQLLCRTHFLLTGYIEKAPSRVRLAFKGFRFRYLLHRKYENFDFIGFVKRCRSLSQSKRKKDTTITINEIAAEFSNDTITPGLAEICRLLMDRECQIETNDGSIVLTANAEMSSLECVYEVLEKNGRVMSVSAIMKALNAMWPEKTFVENSVRNCLRNKEKFIYIGRASTYGLKKWESERPDLKGGTIRDLVEGFLLGCGGHAASIKAVTKYVTRYRRTKSSNIVTNLKLDGSGRFLITEGVIALANDTVSRGKRVRSEGNLPQ